MVDRIVVTQWRRPFYNESLETQDQYVSRTKGLQGDHISEHELEGDRVFRTFFQ